MSASYRIIIIIIIIVVVVVVVVWKTTVNYLKEVPV